MNGNAPLGRRAGAPDGGPGAGQKVGWALLGWLAGLGAIPFLSAGALAISEALGLPNQVLGTFGLALAAALVSWVAGRPGTAPLVQFLVGAAFVPVLQTLNAVLVGVTFPVQALAAQTAVAALGAGTYVVLAQRRARLRDR